MYSPRIKEDLIPKLYQRAKEEGISMTKLVDQIIRDTFNSGKLKRRAKERGAEKRK